MEVTQEVYLAAVERGVQAAMAPVAEIEAIKRKGRISRPEVVLAFGISMRKLEQLSADGEGPQYIREGKKYYYRPQDVQAWINSQRMKTIDQE